MLAMLLVLLDQERKVTIFVAPYWALLDELLVTLQAANVDSLEWHVGEKRTARIVLVSADLASDTQFLLYCSHLKRIGRLCRIFIDECHVACFDNFWRPQLAKLPLLREFGVPFYLLTATMPPSYLIDLEELFGVQNMRIIRASTIRPRTLYAVHLCKPDRLRHDVLAFAHRKREQLRPGQKGIIFCEMIGLCETLAANLECLNYHANISDRDERFQHWNKHGGIIVTISALGTGINVRSVVFVLHVDIPDTMVEYAQQTGRGGRAGEQVDCIIFTVENRAELRLKNPDLSPHKEVMLQFVATHGCRRGIMSAYLDGPKLARICSDNADWVNCDRCNEGAHEPRERTRLDEDVKQAVISTLTEFTTGCLYCYLLGQSDQVYEHASEQCRAVTWQ